jgi:1-pyrroline-5-carboxylate dehydrogenase
MSAGQYSIPVPSNEPITAFEPGSRARESLQSELTARSSQVLEIPNVIGGERVFTGNTYDVTMPCDHQHVIARVHMAGPEEIRRATETCMQAKAEWANLPYHQRASVLLRAATLLAGPWRDSLNATTMLGQGKTCYQAEIDASCELIDFWRFNAKYGEEILAAQPPVSPPGVWNRLDHRPLDGFVLAITPFNFTSIALNLATAPALMGNTVLWKPARTSVLSCWEGFRLLEAAGMPPGVINLVHGRGADVGDIVLPHPDLGGVHFTGSTGTFQHIWRTIGQNIEGYRQYPRIVGETGGKDFILAHPSADVDALAVAILRGTFEYQGQKCSAASRMYIPKSLWPGLRERLADEMAAMKMGDVRDFSNFLGAVIDERAFRKHEEYLTLGKQTATTVSGGEADGSKGWFVQPTLFEVDEPHHRLMAEEIFGPIGAVYVYEDSKWDEVMNLVDTTSPYALTGAVFATDRRVIETGLEGLRYAAGNFYVNDKPTGAVVGQQPFGGGRASGTNDKAGSPLNLLRWTSPRAIKETYSPPHDWRYPFLD